MATTPPRYEAVLFDALGTLVRLEPPWPLLAGALRSRHGIEISEYQAQDAMRAEMSYYLEHHTEGRDATTLGELRARCGEVLGRALPPPAADQLTGAELMEVLLESLRFTPYADTAPALGSLRSLGIRIAVVSNWDCSLGGLLGTLGLGGLLDRVVTSAEAGFRKPHPRIFQTALEALQCRPERAIMVGDSVDIDIAGGRAAGIRSVLIDRSGLVPEQDDVERILTLANLPALLGGSPIV